MNREEIIRNIDLTQLRQCTGDPTTECLTDNTVSFCCPMDPPSGFGLATPDVPNPSILYNTTFLTCNIESCPVTSTVCGCPISTTIYKIVVSGQLPFIINQPMTFATGCPSPDATATEVNLYCSKSLNVNNIVCIQCNEAAAQAACTAMTALLADCTNTTVSALTITDAPELLCPNGTSDLFTVSGTFTLPACPPQP